MFDIEPTRENCFTPRIAKSFVESWLRRKHKEDIFDTPSGEIIVGRWYIVKKGKRIPFASKQDFVIALCEELSLAFGSSA